MEANRTIAWAFRRVLFGAFLLLTTVPPATSHEPGSSEAASPGASGGFGGPFVLVDHTGKTVTDADFHGKLLVVYFGYTNCPDICPIDASNIGAAMDLLGDENSAVQPVFITIDPDRDKPTRLARWLGAVHPRFIGLTGTSKQSAAVAEAYKVVFERVKTTSGYDYTMYHPGLIYVMDVDGQFLFLLPPGTDPETIATEIRAVLPRTN